VHVRCHFEKGVAALVSEDEFRKADEYLMEELVSGDSGEQRTKACGPDGVSFDVPAGRYELMVGQTDTYTDKRGYAHNGFKRALDVAGPIELDLHEAELTDTFPCISCPYLYVWDGTGYVPRGQVLRDIRSPAAEREERTPIQAIVVGKAIRLRLAEEEDEVSHVNALLLEVGGKLVAPDVSALATADKSYGELHTGESVELRYAVDLPDGPVPVTVVATGYYVPLAAAR
jgi:hypothetical protein